VKKTALPPGPEYLNLSLSVSLRCDHLKTEKWSGRPAQDDDVAVGDRGHRLCALRDPAGGRGGGGEDGEGARLPVARPAVPVRPDAPVRAAARDEHRHHGDARSPEMGGLTGDGLMADHEDGLRPDWTSIADNEDGRG
jgi:hypothetical protein